MFSDQLFEYASLATIVAPRRGYFACSEGLCRAHSGESWARHQAWCATRHLTPSHGLVRGWLARPRPARGRATTGAVAGRRRFGRSLAADCMTGPACMTPSLPTKCYGSYDDHQPSGVTFYNCTAVDMHMHGPMWLHVCMCAWRPLMMTTAVQYEYSTTGRPTRPNRQQMRTRYGCTYMYVDIVRTVLATLDLVAVYGTVEYY